MMNEAYLWEALLPFIGNPFGVAGLMGNLYAESGLEPTALEGAYRKKMGMTGQEYTEAVDAGRYGNFCEDGAGYGLAQWTYAEHKRRFLAYAVDKRRSIGDLEMQTSFLMEDLKRFSSVLNVLRRCTSIREGSDDVLTRYENPADQSEAMKAKRASYGEAILKRQFKVGDNMTISNTAFCALIHQALREGWGYIWGAYGQTWTQKDQDNATRDMTIKYGQQWVGKRVADCSGLGYWAFKQLGGSVYHGSNTMWNEYVTDRTALIDGMRADGETMYPGDPVFINNDGKRSHVGYYMGGGIIIEAAGTATGVVSNLNGGKGKSLPKWNETAHWKNMQYFVTDDVYTGGDEQMYPTLRKGAIGEDVKKLQGLLFKAGYTVTVDGVYGSGTVQKVKDFQADNGLTVDGIAGPITWTKLVSVTSENVVIPELEKVSVNRVEIEAVINTLKRWLE